MKSSGQSPHNVSWVVLPLFHQKHDDGFALIGLDSNDGAFYEAVRVHISAGLGGLLRPGAQGPRRHPGRLG